MALSCFWVGPGMLASGRDWLGQNRRVRQHFISWGIGGPCTARGHTILPGRETGKQQLTSLLQTKVQLAPLMTALTCQGWDSTQAQAQTSHTAYHPTVK